MVSALSNHVDNLMGEIHKTKCKDCGCCLKYRRVQTNLIKYECLSCSNLNLKKLNEGLKKIFKNTFKFSINEINKFFLFLRKGVILMNLWMIGNKLMKQHYLKRKKLEQLRFRRYYIRGLQARKRICKDFEIRN